MKKENHLMKIQIHSPKRKPMTKSANVLTKYKIRNKIIAVFSRNANHKIYSFTFHSIP